jgi:hypothetical protein
MAYEQTKETLTQIRKGQAVNAWGSDEYHELEKAYGKYLFVPLDIPVIQANDHQAFVEFFHANSVNSRRLKEDIAGAPPNIDIANYTSTFKSIDSHPTTNNSIWVKNCVPEIFHKFSELFEQIYEYYPIHPKTLKFSMWSSQMAVQPHRDETSMLDLPINFRIKLFDNNPFETLKLHLSPMDKQEVETYRFKVPADTNSWVWNNLRTKHSSIKVGGREKILMIMYLNGCDLNMNKFVDLLDRSISKYKDSIIIDTHTTSTDYINH